MLKFIHNFLIAYHGSKHFNEKFRLILLYEPVLEIFTLIDQSCFIHKKGDKVIKKFCLQFNEVFLELVYDIIRVNDLTPLQKHKLASLVYNSLTSFVTSPYYDENRSHVSTILMYMIILSGISQPDIVEAMMERILSDLENSSTLKILEQFQGHLIIFSFLGVESSEIVTLSTSILVHLAHAGTLCLKLDSQDLLNDLIRVPTLPCVVGLLTNPTTSKSILENISVLLQKCSKLR